MKLSLEIVKETEKIIDKKSTNPLKTEEKNPKIVNTPEKAILEELNAFLKKTSQILRSKNRKRNFCNSKFREIKKYLAFYKKFISISEFCC